MYQGLEEPKFSDGWLSGFKARHAIKRHRMHGEAGAVDLVEAAQKMEVIVNITKQYSLHDIFNMDETGLF